MGSIVRRAVIGVDRGISRALISSRCRSTKPSPAITSRARSRSSGGTRFPRSRATSGRREWARDGPSTLNSSRTRWGCIHQTPPASPCWPTSPCLRRCWSWTPAFTRSGGRARSRSTTSASTRTSRCCARRSGSIAIPSGRRKACPTDWDGWRSGGCVSWRSGACGRSSTSALSTTGCWKTARSLVSRATSRRRARRPGWRAALC